MAWNDTEQDKLGHQLRLIIGGTVRVSQILSLAPYPLSLFQGNRAVTGTRLQVLIFFRHMFAIFITGATVASQFVLFFFYPHLLYNETVPIFIKILYYIVNVLQTMTVAIMLIGCERRRTLYEDYFSNVLPLVKETLARSDCRLTIWYRNTARFLLLVYSTVAILIPFIMVSVLQQIGTIPYTIAQVVPYTVSYLILAQYYCVFVHLSSILRKLNEYLTPLVSTKAELSTVPLYENPKLYGVIIQPIEGAKASTSRLEKIERLRLLHVQTIEIGCELCRNLGVIIVMIVVAAFASVNIELLELYQCIKNSSLSPMNIIIKFVFAMIKFSFNVLIAYPNRLIQIENQRTLFMLYRIQRTSCTPETNSAIEHYISQISNLHDIHLACGMINLDMKLISTVVAAITSIMVVLIQFSDSGA